TATGTLTVTAGGTISQSGALTVAGPATFTATAGNIVLTNAGNDFQNTVAATAGADVTIIDANTLTLGTITASSDLLPRPGTAIVDGNGPAINVQSATLVMSATTGIGSGDALETQVTRLAATDTASGNIEVNNSVGLTIANLRTGVGVTRSGATA